MLIGSKLKVQYRVPGVILSFVCSSLTASMNVHRYCRLVIMLVSLWTKIVCSSNNRNRFHRKPWSLYRLESMNAHRLQAVTKPELPGSDSLVRLLVLCSTDTAPSTNLVFHHDHPLVFHLVKHQPMIIVAHQLMQSPPSVSIILLTTCSIVTIFLVHRWIIHRGTQISSHHAAYG